MDVHSRAQRSGNMAAIRAKNTRPEMIVRRFLHRLGFRYVLHHRKLPGHPDIVFPSRRKVIFVHGCFWHMHNCRFGRVIPATRTEFWQTKRARTVARDSVSVQKLREDGWRVFIAWECELRNPEAVLTRMVTFLGDNAPAVSPRRRRLV